MQNQRDMETYEEERLQLKKQAPALFALREQKPLLLPTSFFETLESEIVRQCLPEASFETPDFYFKKVEIEINKRIGHSTTEKSQPEVPHGYFNDLNFKILDQTLKAEAGHLINLKTKQRRLKTFLTLAASMIAFWLLTREIAPEEKCETFACLLEKTDLTSEELLLIYDETIVEDLLESDASLLESIDSDHEMIDYLLEGDINLDELWYEPENK